MQIPNDVLDWLMQSPDPWVVYRTSIDLLGESPDSPTVQALRKRLQSDSRIDQWLHALTLFPPLQRYSVVYASSHPMWLLTMLAEFGLDRRDPRIEALAETIFAAQHRSGAFLHGGFTKPRIWDYEPYMPLAHVMTYALARFGYLDDRRLARAYDNIIERQRLDGGWHPRAEWQRDREKEEWPSDPAGTVNVLGALAANPAMRDSDEARAAVEFVLNYWQHRQTHEGTYAREFPIDQRFFSLNYPFIKWGLLKTLFVLSHFPFAVQDKRFHEMRLRLTNKRYEMKWFAGSVYNEWREYDFGQRQGPSRWITLLALMIWKRADP